MTPSTEGLVLCTVALFVLTLLAVLYFLVTSVTKEVLDALSRAVLIGGGCTALAALYAPELGKWWHQMATDYNQLIVGLVTLVVVVVGIYLILHSSHDTIGQGICLIAAGASTFFLRIDGSRDPSTNWFVAATLVTIFLFSFFSSLSLSLFRK